MLCRRRLAAPAKLLAQPGDVVREAGHRVLLVRAVALAVASKINGHGAMGSAELLHLGFEEGVVAAPAVDEHHRAALPNILVRQRHAVAGRLLHVRSLLSLSSRPCREHAIDDHRRIGYVPIMSPLAARVNGPLIFICDRQDWRIWASTPPQWAGSRPHSAAEGLPLVARARRRTGPGRRGRDLPPRVALSASGAPSRKRRGRLPRPEHQQVPQPALGDELEDQVQFALDHHGLLLPPLQGGRESGEGRPGRDQATEAKRAGS